MIDGIGDNCGDVLANNMMPAYGEVKLCRLSMCQMFFFSPICFFCLDESFASAAGPVVAVSQMSFVITSSP